VAQVAGLRDRHLRRLKAEAAAIDAEARQQLEAGIAAALGALMTLDQLGEVYVAYGAPPAKHINAQQLRMILQQACRGIVKNDARRAA
jgi:hypothetical protein